MPFFLLTAFILKSILSDKSITTPVFFLFPFTWNSFFHPFTFSLCVSLYLKWVSCRQQIVRSCFLSFQHYFLWLENLVHLHLNAILLVFFSGCFVVLPFFFLFICDMKTSFICYRFLLCGYHGSYIQQCMFIMACFKLITTCIWICSKALPFTHPHVNVFDITFYIFLSCVSLDLIIVVVFFFLPLLSFNLHTL